MPDPINEKTIKLTKEQILVNPLAEIYGNGKENPPTCVFHSTQNFGNVAVENGGVLSVPLIYPSIEAIQSDVNIPGERIIVEFEDRFGVYWENPKETDEEVPSDS